MLKLIADHQLQMRQLQTQARERDAAFHAAQAAQQDAEATVAELKRKEQRRIFTVKVCHQLVCFLSPILHLRGDNVPFLIFSLHSLVFRIFSCKQLQLIFFFLVAVVLALTDGTGRVGVCSGFGPRCMSQTLSILTEIEGKQVTV